MKVLIGISGGVDSAVSALLLKKNGYTVIGATMKLLNDDKTIQMIEDAKKVCDEIGIEHLVFDFSKEFKEKVINNFIQEYQNGRTPNPCVVCNKYFKFGLLYEKAKELGCDYISTGHYVNILEDKLCNCANEKDQSYFLYAINKDVLPKIIFPLKDYDSKDEIRKIALENNLSVFNKRDSQEICFVDNDDYISFLKDKIPSKPGDIVDCNGQILGHHEGLYKYTIGQRKGLGIIASEPLYVKEIDVSNNRLILGRNDDLYAKKLIATNINLLVSKLPTKCLAKVRSRGAMEECEVKIDDDKMIVTFDKKVRAITKGQSVVLYDNNICLGGGIIDEIIN